MREYFEYKKSEKLIKKKLNDLGYNCVEIKWGKTPCISVKNEWTDEKFKTYE